MGSQCAPEQVPALAVQEGFCSGSPIPPRQGLRQTGNTRFTRLNIFSSASPSEVLPASASPPAAKEGEGLPQPQVGPGRLTQPHPSAQPWVRNQHQDQAGKPPASLAPAAPSSETSEQNVPGWELETGVCSLLRICKRPSRRQRRSLQAPPRPTGGR